MKRHTNNFTDAIMNLLATFKPSFLKEAREVSTDSNTMIKMDK